MLLSRDAGRAKNPATQVLLSPVSPCREATNCSRLAPPAAASVSRDACASVRARGQAASATSSLGPVSTSEAKASMKLIASARAAAYRQAAVTAVWMMSVRSAWRLI
jgi:hypothetical protein